MYAIANISGNTVEEYCEMVEILSDSSVDMIEMNISNTTKTKTAIIPFIKG